MSGGGKQQVHGPVLLLSEQGQHQLLARRIAFQIGVVPVVGEARGGKVQQLRQQRASGVALCAMDRMLAGDPGDAAALTPNYLRMAQAERTRQNNQDFYLKK